MSTNTLAQAARHALLWCSSNPGWTRACDILDTQIYFVQWDDLAPFARAAWADAQEYEHFATKDCKVRHGFVASTGEFFEDVTRIPESLRLEPVFFVGIKAAKAQRTSGTVELGPSANTSFLSR